MEFRSYYKPKNGGWKNDTEINSGEVVVDQAAAEEVKDILEKMIRGERPASGMRKGIYNYDLSKDKIEDIKKDPTRSPGWDIVDSIPILKDAEIEMKRIELSKKKKDLEKEVEKLDKEKEPATVT